MKQTRRDTAVWSLSPEDTLKELRTSSKGLCEEEVQKRKKKCGSNQLLQKKQVTPIKIFVRQFLSPLVFVLLAAAAVTAFLQEWIDTVFIVLAVLINVGLSFYQEYRAENTIEKLASYIKERVRVIRAGTEREINAEELVPGDIIHLTYGSRVSADARLLSNNSLATEEAVLTGESLPVRKNLAAVSEGTAATDRSNMVFAGTMVVEGYGTAVVTAIGKDTEIGRIAELVANVGQERTPLQASLWRLAWVIFAGVLVIVAGLFWLGISRGEPALEMLIVAIAVAVGAIPEALPIVLTVILAVGSERLAKAGGVIRNLAAAETLGSASTILVDKTGTLTQADMQLTGLHSFAEITVQKKQSNKQEKAAILQLAAAATNVMIENPEDDSTTWRVNGSAIEAGILKGLQKLYPKEFTHRIAQTPHILLPFNSAHKFSVAQDYKTTTTRIVLGAPDILLDRSQCDKESYVNANRWLEQMSLDGYRLLAVATLPESSTSEIAVEDVHDLEFMGVLAFQDPLREDTVAAVQAMEKSGAQVIMVTGDLKGTAMAIGKELGWSIAEGNVLTGSELQKLSNEQLLPHLPKLKIFARMTPEDKLRIAHVYRQQGEVVAMTGDGVNDAPSLRAVDIGIALGSGSDVAKSAADLVLLNDTFATIVAAIEEGRRILINIRKSFVYLISNSLDEVILIGGALLFMYPLPLSALQIIWVNLFTGSLPALALAFDTNNETDNFRRRGHSSIFNTEVKLLTLGIGLISSLLLLALYILLLERGVETEAARSVLFICFASYILVAAYAFRSLRKPLFTFPTFSNRFLNWSVAGSGVLIIASVTVPYLQDLFVISVPPVSLLWIIPIWLIVSVGLVETAKACLNYFDLG